MRKLRYCVFAPGILLVLAFPPSATHARGQTLTETLMLPMSDGVRLSAVVNRPAGPGPHPVVLIVSPYRGRGGDMDWLAKRLTPHGYAVVEVAVRGTGGSEGDFAPFAHEARDGRAMLDWLSAQPWAGKIGLFGISYVGWSAYALAETRHPAISAMVVSSWADLGPFLAPGGAFHLMAHVPWLIAFRSGGGGLPPPETLDRIFRTVPLRSLFGGFEAVGSVAGRGYDWSAVDLPVLHWTGWFDYTYRDTLDAHARLSGGKRHAKDQRLVVGAWAHNGEFAPSVDVGGVDFGPAAAAGPDSLADWTRRFFDRHLRGVKVDDASARVFFMGENSWRTFDRWPPRNARRLVLYVSDDAALVTQTPKRGAETSFTYDPNDPVPTLGGVISHFFPDNLGPVEQSPLNARSDVVRFTSEAFASDLILAGPLRAVLWVAADAPSTDVTAKLVHVTADGRATIIEDGIRRLTGLAAGPQDVIVELGQRALRLPAGSRLRLDVSGGNFPKYNRNPNTGDEPMAASTFRPVRLTLHSGGRHASRLELTVLPR